MIMNWIYLIEGSQILDQLNWIVIVVGIGIILLSLLFVSWFITYIIKIILNLIPGKSARKKGTEPVVVQTADTTESDEVNAAIAMTIYLYFNELHDVESGVVTIKRISRHYSPWNSKLYHMRNL